MDQKKDAYTRMFLQETFTALEDSNTFTLRAIPAFIFEVTVTKASLYSFVGYTLAGNLLTVTDPITAGDEVNIKYVTGKMESPPQASAYTVGPGGGGRLMFPAINPKDSNNIFITCDMSSAFVSHDGGETFQCCTTWGHIGTPNWFFNRHDEHIVYAVMSPNGSFAPPCIYKSNDKGRSWKLMQPASENFVGLAYSHWGDREQVPLPVYKTGTFAFSSDLLAVHVHPSDAETIFASTSGNNKVNAMIYRSVDDGVTWEILADLGTKVPHLIPNVHSTYTKMAVVGNDLYIINNAGLFHINLQTKAVTAKAFVNISGTIQFAGTQVLVTMIADKGVSFDTKHYANMVVRSTDFGTTWTNLTDSFIERAATHTGFSLPDHQEQNFLVTPLMIRYRFLAITGNTIYVGFSGGDWRSDGVAKSTDGGQSWVLVYLGRHRNTYIQQFTTLGPIDTACPNTSFSSAIPHGLATAAGKGDTAIMTNMTDAMMTNDGGITWRSLASCRSDAGQKPVPAPEETPFWKTTGIEPAGQSIVAIDPFHLNHHLAGWTDIGIMESFDGGQSWTPRQIPNMAHSNCHAIAFDPHRQGVVLAAPTTVQGGFGANAGPAQGLDYVNAANTARIGGIARSTDGGVTWSTSYRGNASANVLSDVTNAGLPTRSVVTGIVFDPVSKGIVYASVLGAGVYKSVDGGISWAAWNNGIALQSNKAGQSGIVAYKLILGQDKRTLFVLLYDTDANRDRNAILVRRAPAYYLNIQNQNDIWTELNRPNGTLGNTLVSLDMDKDGVIYAAPHIVLANWNMVPFNGGVRYNYTRGGVYVSSDMGKSWRQMYHEHLRVPCVKVDSNNNNVLYITTHMGKVYKSVKGKETAPADWVELPGINYYGAQYIFENPQNPERIYVTTIGSGTWSVAVK